MVANLEPRSYRRSQTAPSSWPYPSPSTGSGSPGMRSSCPPDPGACICLPKRSRVRVVLLGSRQAKTCLNMLYSQPFYTVDLVGAVQFYHFY